MSGTRRPDYYRARYYEPSIGRFASEDPSRFGSGDFDLFRYANNLPTNGTDPSGLWTVSIGGTVKVNFGFLSGSYSGGFVMDGHGNFGVYNTYTPVPGAGWGTGGLNNLVNLATSPHYPFFSPRPGSSPIGGFRGGIGVSLAGSNAETICDLGGPFVNGSIGLGEGAMASMDGFAGPSDHGTVVGGGVTVGAGIGGGGSLGITNTHITPLLVLDAGVSKRSTTCNYEAYLALNFNSRICPGGEG